MGVSKKELSEKSNNPRLALLQKFKFKIQKSNRPSPKEYGYFFVILSNISTFFFFRKSYHEKHSHQCHRCAHPKHRLQSKSILQPAAQNISSTGSRACSDHAEHRLSLHPLFRNQRTIYIIYCRRRKQTKGKSLKVPTPE